MDALFIISVQIFLLAGIFLCIRHARTNKTRVFLLSIALVGIVFLATNIDANRNALAVSSATKLTVDFNVSQIGTLYTITVSDVDCEGVGSVGSDSFPVDTSGTATYKLLVYMPDGYGDNYISDTYEIDDGGFSLTVYFSGKDISTVDFSGKLYIYYANQMSYDRFVWDAEEQDGDRTTDVSDDEDYDSGVDYDYEYSDLTEEETISRFFGVEVPFDISSLKFVIVLLMFLGICAAELTDNVYISLIVYAFAFQLAIITLYSVIANLTTSEAWSLFDTWIATLRNAKTTIGALAPILDVLIGLCTVLKITQSAIIGLWVFADLFSIVLAGTIVIVVYILFKTGAIISLVQNYTGLSVSGDDDAEGN